MNMPLNRVRVGETIAGLPFRNGYHPAPGSIGVQSYDATGATGVSAVLVSTPGATPTEDAAAAAQMTAPAFAATGVSQLLVLGYGPDGLHTARLYLEAMRDLTADQVELTLAHVEPDRFMIRSGNLDILELDDLAQWHPTPTVSAANWVAEGRPMPAASRQQLYDRYRPLPEPACQALPASVAADLDATSPKFRIEVATRDLEQISTSHGTVPVPAMPRLAHLAKDNVVRDRLVGLLAAQPSPPQVVDALVRTYRSVPASEREAVGGLAAATAYVSHLPAPALEAIITHCPASRLASLTAEVMSRGIPPDTLAQIVRDMDSATLTDAAEQTWREQHAANQLHQQTQDPPPASREHNAKLLRSAFPDAPQPGQPDRAPTPLRRPGRGGHSPDHGRGQ